MLDELIAGDRPRTVPIDARKKQRCLPLSEGPNGIESGRDEEGRPFRLDKADRRDGVMRRAYVRCALRTAIERQKNSGEIAL